MKRWIALIVLQLLAAPILAEELGLYLFRIDTESKTTSDSISLQGVQKFSLQTTNGEKLKENLKISTIEFTGQGEDSISIQSHENDVFVAPPESSHLKSSFVVDFDESEVAPLIQLVTEKYGTKPSPNDLIEFVDASITTKSFARGFDLASGVAKRREGDCTEHAVLLAALARAFKYPARIVIGLLVLTDGKKLDAAGHAWTEVYVDSRWQIADATRPSLGFTGHQHRHIPLVLFEDESAAFRMGLLTAQSIVPRKVIQLVQ